MKNKWLRRFLETILIIFLLLAFYPVNINIHRQMNAVEVKIDNPDYLVPRTVTVDGKYSFRLLSKDSFEGHIQIEGYQLTDFDLDDFMIAPRQTLWYEKQVSKASVGPEPIETILRFSAADIYPDFFMRHMTFSLYPVMGEANEITFTDQNLLALERPLNGYNDKNTWIVTGVSTRQEAIERVKEDRPDIFKNHIVE